VGYNLNIKFTDDIGVDYSLASSCVRVRKCNELSRNVHNDISV